MCSARFAERASTARISSPRRCERGAAAVVARPEALVEGVPHLAADEPRKLFAELAAQFFAPYPETIVAVTGTNGKTSTVELTRQLWRMAGHRSASIGTLGVTTADDQVKTGLTTPDIVTFLSNMAGLKRMGISHVAYEASSHGLDQYRAEGVTGEGRGVHQLQPRPSRLSSRHGRLFRGQDAAVRRGGRGGRDGGRVDRRCQVGRRHRPCQARGACKLVTVGPGAETIELVSRQSTPLGQQLVLRHEGKEHKLALPLIGAYQMNNVLTAAGLVLATGGDWATTLVRAWAACRRSAGGWSGR